ncbi:hypothetical protein GGI17_005679 [Coemansia sp. S146]|nr:hypothetical protein GGI17_005679 [Coemansia sp. S146]
MTSLSLFQFLPVHIVKLIVKFIRVSDYWHGDRVKHQQLLWVCDNFRTVVYSLYNRCHELRISGPACKAGATCRIKQCPWVLCRYYNSHSSYHLAKDLRIHVELECIYSGKALTLLSRAPYRDCIFPLVRSVSFASDMIIMRKDRDIYASCAHDNIAAFVQRLRQMTPRAHGFNLGVYSRVRWPENTMGHFGSLVNQILQYTSRFKNSLLDYRRPIALNFDGICNLAHINYAFDSNRELCEDDICVEYSRLQKLTLNLDCDPATLQRPVLGTFVAFPVLRHLSIKHEYPLGDDTLFRGNAATLEYLRMRMHGSTATMLRERRVFTRSSHPKLQYVVTHGVYGSTTDRIATSVDSMRFVLSIGSKAAARVIGGLSCDRDIPCSLQLLGEHKSIQILKLDGLRFSFLEVISLIKSLPLLSDLSSDSPNLDSHLTDIPKVQLVKTEIPALGYELVSRASGGGSRMYNAAGIDMSQFRPC